MNDTITVRVEMDAKTFRSFAWFDAFSRQKRWRSPALFAAILLAFAAVCFLMQGRAEQAALLGGVLTAVGVILPLGYFLQFYVTLRDQVKKFGLSQPKEVYSLTFSPEHVLVTNGKEENALAWDSIFAAYRRKGCIYLYAAANKAFLLPEDQIPGGGDGLWAMLEGHMAPERLFARG